MKKITIVTMEANAYDERPPIADITVTDGSIGASKGDVDKAIY